ncbi:MAG: hypothetical protein H6908_03995 [Hyphomicrobiales bacterium]|nr:hypothetical protein [Hyphomicrobiales bacterium]
MKPPYFQPRIAIICADHELSLQLKRALPAPDTEASFFTNEAEFRKGIGNASFDVLILDSEKQDIPTLSLLHLLHDSPESPDRFLPVVLLTASKVPPEESPLLYPLGKPFMPEDLQALLHRILSAPMHYVVSTHYIGPCRRGERKG